ncbi:M56 family metallopeptidase [Massilia sp. S19_KUP03_FR1]|uniref:M56 family metallopeptidase n=1 Tax=Massilia sp. S19_KUP03_FR1 TaxID=3025503 RepID=UPI002FCDA756
MMATLIGHLGATLLDFIWQGALIACVAGIGMVALRKRRPQARYALACLALLACLAWPVADLLARLHAPALVDGTAGLALRAGTGALYALVPLHWPQAHPGAIVLAWASCTCAMALRMLAGLWWIARAARSPCGDAAWQARITSMAGRFGIRRTVRLRVVDDIASPVTAGWLRPVVLLPASLLTGMPPELLEALLAHELGHVKRADYVVNLLQNVIETLLFYHPAVWWLSRCIRIERERIADDLAAQHVGAHRLARALSELEKRQFSHHDLALAANGGELMFRITRLLRPAPQGLNWKAALPVLGLTAALIAGCAQVAPAPPASVTSAATPAVVQFASCPAPVYPDQSLRDRDTGTVALDLLVGADGTVRDSRVNRSSGHLPLDEAARLAIAKCSFKPAMENGRAVQSWVPVAYLWTLQ